MSEQGTATDERFVMVRAHELIKQIEREAIIRYLQSRDLIYDEKSGRIQLMRLVADLKRAHKKEDGENAQWHKAYMDLTEVYLDCNRQLFDEARKHGAHIADLEKAHHVLELVIERSEKIPFLWDLMTLAENVVGRKSCKS